MLGAGHEHQKAAVGRHRSYALAEPHGSKTLCGSHPVAQASVAAELGCSNKAEDTLQQPESFSRWREAPNLTGLAVLS